jgi:hypothetical protein
MTNLDSSYIRKESTIEWIARVLTKPNPNNPQFAAELNHFYFYFRSKNSNPDPLSNSSKIPLYRTNRGIFGILHCSFISKSGTIRYQLEIDETRFPLLAKAFGNPASGTNPGGSYKGIRDPRDWAPVGTISRTSQKDYDRSINETCIPINLLKRTAWIYDSIDNLKDYLSYETENKLAILGLKIINRTFGSRGFNFIKHLIDNGVIVINTPQRTKSPIGSTTPRKPKSKKVSTPVV